jgi:hypothetical protein
MPRTKIQVVNVTRTDSKLVVQLVKGVRTLRTVAYVCDLAEDGGICGGQVHTQVYCRGLCVRDVTRRLTRRDALQSVLPLVNGS